MSLTRKEMIIIWWIICHQIAINFISIAIVSKYIKNFHKNVFSYCYHDTSIKLGDLAEY